MTALVTKADDTVLAQIKALSERVLSKAEYEALAAIPIGEEERLDKLALIEWFTRRYPTPAQRLAYVRRAHAAWTRSTSG